MLNGVDKPTGQCYTVSSRSGSRGKEVKKMGYKLKECREDKRMTQEELAKKSGVSRPTIVAIENGKTGDVKLSTLQKLAEALDSTVEAIFF